MYLKRSFDQIPWHHKYSDTSDASLPVKIGTYIGPIKLGCVVLSRTIRICLCILDMCVCTLRVLDLFQHKWCSTPCQNWYVKFTVKTFIKTNYVTCPYEVQPWIFSLYFLNMFHWVMLKLLSSRRVFSSLIIKLFDSCIFFWGGGGQNVLRCFVVYAKG